MSIPKLIDIFGPGANPGGRIFRELNCLLSKIASCRGLDLRIVLTSGTFDITHIGHLRYLEEAKKRGDILIVGVDSDEKVRQRKGPTRPIVGEDERMEILCHSRAVDAVFLKSADAERWELIKAIRPDVLIIVRGTYNEKEIEGLQQYCGEVIVLDPQATTSTTARVRSLLVDHASTVRDRMRAAMSEIEECFRDLIGNSVDPPTDTTHHETPEVAQR